jgi:hypothetical protein
MQSTILTVVVITNISEKLLPSLATPHKVKKLVLLLLAELVSCVVPRRPKTRREIRRDWDMFVLFYGVQKLWTFFKLRKCYVPRRIQIATYSSMNQSIDG